MTTAADKLVEYALSGNANRGELIEPAEVIHDGWYRDPPNISFGNAIPPESAWPGRRSNADDVAAACGDGRDWFRYWHRLQRQHLYWQHYDYWAPKRSTDDYFRNFSWNERLIIGQYGAGKTTLSINAGKDRIKRGFPFFHNGSSLIGWKLTGDQIFTAMATIPPCSRLLVDEAHTTLPGRLAGATAVAVFVALGANIRKDNCILDIVSAQWEAVHPLIRRDCVEVIRPFRVKATADASQGSAVHTWNDPRNFLLAWDVWEGSPMNDPEVRKEGLDARPYDYWAMDSGNSARDAYILTDSFQRIDAGAAILANKEGIKDRLREIRADLHSDGAGTAINNAVMELVGALAIEDNLVESIPSLTAQQIGRLVAEDYSVTASPQLIGMAINELFGVNNPQGDYSTADLIDRYRQYQER